MCVRMKTHRAAGAVLTDFHLLFSGHPNTRGCFYILSKLVFRVTWTDTCEVALDVFAGCTGAISEGPPTVAPGGFSFGKAAAYSDLQLYNHSAAQQNPWFDLELCRLFKSHPAILIIIWGKSLHTASQWLVKKAGVVCHAKINDSQNAGKLVLCSKGTKGLKQLFPVHFGVWYYILRICDDTVKEYRSDHFVCVMHHTGAADLLYPFWQFP